MGRRMERTEVLPVGYRPAVEEKYGTLKKAYMVLDLMEASITYPQFVAILSGTATTPAKANYLQRKLDAVVKLSKTESAKTKDRRKRRMVALTDKFIKETNKGRAFKFRTLYEEDGNG